MARGKRLLRVVKAPRRERTLVERMTTLTVSPKKRNRKKNVTRMVTVPAAETLVTQINNRRTRKRGSAQSQLGAPIGNGGQITLVRSELFQAIYSAPTKSETLGSIAVTPVKAVMSFLWRLSQCYTRLRWNSMSFQWKPAVGTSTSGLITYGLRLMDDRTSGTPADPTSRADVQALFPVMDHAVWQTSTLTINKDLLMSRKWYAISPSTQLPTDAETYDFSPGSFQYGCAHDTDAVRKFYGEFWVTYSVTLDGTRSA
nr:MAG: capsid protein [Arachnid permutotetra-like virus]